MDMKIDMTVMTAVEPNIIEIKNSSNENAFLSVLGKELEDSISIEFFEDEDLTINNELLAMISDLFNKTNANYMINTEGIDIKNVVEDSGTNELKYINDIEIKSHMESLDEREVYILENLGELSKANVVNSDTVNKNINKLKINSIEESLGKLIQNEEESISEAYCMKERITEATEKIAGNNFESLDMDIINRRKILVEDINDYNDELNILNNIAFSGNEIEKNVTDINVQVIRSKYVSEDIVQAIKYINNNNIEELNLKINPKDLGEISIKFLKGKTENKVIITSDNSDSFKLINENIKDIEKHLSILDIKVNEISVEIKSNNESSFNGNFNRQFNDNSREERKSKFTKIQKEEYGDDIGLEEGNIDYLI